MDRHAGTAVMIAVVLVVLALGALAEVVVGRSVAASPEPSRASTWEPLLRAGDAARAQGDAAAARRAYLTGLFRARGERSLTGVVWAAEGFAALGDEAVVEQALAMTVTLADAGEPAARARLAALRARRQAAAAAPETFIR